MRFKYQWHSELPPHILSFLRDGEYYDIEPVSETRTSPQNRVLWGYYYKESVKAFSLKGTIISIDQFHFFAKTLLPKKKKKCKITGRIRAEERSTTTLSKKKFNLYIEAIKLWVYENLQYSIQDPTDNEALLYYDSQINYGNSTT